MHDDLTFREAESSRSEQGVGKGSSVLVECAPQDSKNKQLILLLYFAFYYYLQVAQKDTISQQYQMRDARHVRLEVPVTAQILHAIVLKGNID
jgi:hypothetical protein